ncbi:adenylate/guanylate cyclase domain-containing protein [Microvirga sp. VF16]|uniref:adenylate/guanylate cyclase domain-containing protein n=1 Tax=Microvirga sp. VF16 TaxID=2807101 RepID=UPI001FEF629C|nr:adenylate/guanylate cyclase domain-containing protein [Microvirga sp. VF16]
MDGSRRALARRSLEAALLGAEPIAGLRFVGCLHVGSVIYGNIGSPDRLDFTVVGPTVNFVSRLESVAKSANAAAACSREVAACFPAETTRRLGTFVLPGIPDAQAIFELVSPGSGPLGDQEAGSELKPRREPGG